jgi:hypothetical protein
VPSTTPAPQEVASLVAERLIAIPGRPSSEDIEQVGGAIEVGQHRSCDRRTRLARDDEAPLGAAQHGAGEVKRGRR